MKGLLMMAVVPPDPTTHPAGHRALHARGGGQPCDLHAMMAIGSFLDNLDIGAWQAQQDI